MTKSAPHKATQLFVWGKLTFDERVVLNRVAGFRGVKVEGSGLVFKAHRHLYHSTLGLRVIKKKFRGSGAPAVHAIQRTAVRDLLEVLGVRF